MKQPEYIVDDQVQLKLSEGEHNAPEPWRELADAINARGRGDHAPIELPVVQGRMHDGEIRVDEADLDPGRYRVEFDGQIIGEVRVIDPIVGMKSNRIDRRSSRHIDRYKLPPHPLGGLKRKSR